MSATPTVRATPMPLPAVPPPGYARLEREPAFDAGRHLALETPTERLSLADFGYAADEIAGCPAEFAVTSAFRVLSDEGVACLQEVARGLAPYARKIERISRMVRGGVYQSRFLADLCTAPELTEAISEIAGVPVLPHSIPHQLGHLNYNPFDVGENVDKWHTDTLRLDFVLFVTDPTAIAGGEFQYFHGTKHEAAALKKAGAPLPADRIRAPGLPGPGYAVMQQGDMVVHRARGLDAPGERITMVNGYVPAEAGFPDYTRFDQLALADPEPVAASEFARHAAWLARERLAADITRFAFTPDRERLAEDLEAVAQSLTDAARDIRAAGEADMEHFGDG